MHVQQLNGPLSARLGLLPMDSSESMAPKTHSGANHMTEILFVHGALVRDGAWWWQPVADLVRAATGVRSRALALPSCGETDAAASSSGLSEDAKALREALDCECSN